METTVDTTIVLPDGMEAELRPMPYRHPAFADVTRFEVLIDGRAVGRVVTDPLAPGLWASFRYVPKADPASWLCDGAHGVAGQDRNTIEDAVLQTMPLYITRNRKESHR